MAALPAFDAPNPDRDLLISKQMERLPPLGWEEGRTIKQLLREAYHAGRADQAEADEPEGVATQQYRLNSTGISALIGRPVTVRHYPADRFLPVTEPTRVVTDVLQAACIERDMQWVSLERLATPKVQHPGYITVEVVA